jgi:hypothetical protein
MRMCVIHFLLPCFFVSSLSLAQSQIKEELLKEFQELSESSAFYSAGPSILDFRDRSFDSRIQAYLFLSAVQEQYSSLGTRVDGVVSDQTQAQVLADPRNYFTKSHDLFAVKLVSLLSYWISPLADASFKREIQKLKTIEEVERLRLELLSSIVQRKLSAAEVEDFILKIRTAIRSLPGVSDDARKRYLQQKYAEHPQNPTLLMKKEIQDDIVFENAVERHHRKESSITTLEAIQFFSHLARNFRSDYSKPIVAWSKMIPTSLNVEAMVQKRNHYDLEKEEAIYRGRQFDGSVAIRFYFSDSHEFKRAVFGSLIPLKVLDSWAALYNLCFHKKISETDRVAAKKILADAFDALMYFVGRNHQYFTRDENRKYQEIIKLIIPEAIEVGGAPAHFWRKEGDHKISLLENRFAALAVDANLEIEFWDGTQVPNFWGAWGIDTKAIGVRSVRGSTEDLGAFSFELDETSSSTCIQFEKFKIDKSLVHGIMMMPNARDIPEQDKQVSVFSSFLTTEKGKGAILNPAEAILMTLFSVRIIDNKATISHIKLSASPLGLTLFSPGLRPL